MSLFPPVFKSWRGPIQEKIDNTLETNFDREEANQIIKYMFKTGGKRCRPLLVILSTKAFGGDPNEALDAAAALEIIHAATLVFDDLIDKDQVRRGAPSVHMAFDIISDLNASVNECIAIADLKTASLFGSAAGIGAAIAGVDGKDLVSMQKFGRSGGMAFQIQDDVLDFHNGSGEQLLKGPNIVTSHCLHEAPRPNHNSDVLNSNNNHSNREVLQLLRKTGSLEFARKRARDYAIEAKASLRKVKRLRNRKILEEYADYLWKRKE